MSEGWPRGTPWGLNGKVVRKCWGACGEDRASRLESGPAYGAWEERREPLPTASGVTGPPRCSPKALTLECSTDGLTSYLTRGT